MGVRHAALLILSIAILAAPLARAEDPPSERSPTDLKKLKETFVSGKDKKDRVKAAIELAHLAPDTLAEALDEIIEAQREGDCDLVSLVAVQVQPRHARLLLVYAATQLGDAGAAFLDKVDNDYPMETRRALEALGFLKANPAFDRVLTQLRNEDDYLAIQAARALGRLATKKQAGQVVQAALNCDYRHVRTHVAWAVLDILGGKSATMGAFGRYRGKKGTIGDRAKEVLNTLADEMAPPQRYKVKLKEVRKFFTRRGGLKIPSIVGTEDHVQSFRAALDEMKRKTPAYHHLVCSAISKITLTGTEKRFVFPARSVNFRPAEVARWKDRDGKPFLNLYNYYLVRYAVILFLGQMGDPYEGHRGWEEGIVEAWQYAMDHTDVALNEDLVEFMKEILRKPPW
ncbi:MAG: HEAT repeat domain-containing protein [Planctomycetota bacterium]|jgi:hypothetical protein